MASLVVSGRRSSSLASTGGPRLIQCGLSGGVTGLRITVRITGMVQREIREQVDERRLRDPARRTGEFGIATSPGVPRTIAASWLRRDASFPGRVVMNPRLPVPVGSLLRCDRLRQARPGIAFAAGWDNDRVLRGGRAHSWRRAANVGSALHRPNGRAALRRNVSGIPISPAGPPRALGSPDRICGRQ